MKILRVIILLVIYIYSGQGMSQSIPSEALLSTEELSLFLTEDVQKNLLMKGNITSANLASYFREKFAERYFYDWKTVEQRFKSYTEIYPSAIQGHSERALDHMAKYSGDTQWKLPFDYLFGEPVNAYALRHLARQHKMVDIAFYYFYQNKDRRYIDYFKDQQRSLNHALAAGAYETIEDGNGVYEAFRSGYRVLNWLQIHNMLLAQENYSDEDQLRTVATLLQHGSHLFERNQKFRSGNHQTRGLSALAMISILLRDFKGTDLWYDHAMDLLQEHLAKEINDDGFQFERTVHYHISDIGNFYYVYQLAKTSELSVSEFWENKLRSLFTTLVKIAYPDKSAPVLSDDTDIPWAEKNDISGALTLGYLLFEDPEMGYFANDHVDAKMFWYLSDAQLSMLKSIQSKKPEYKSLHFPTTGYYIMREGWQQKNHMMIISAGLDDLKPDHQHGDMLGVQAIANGKAILPNYQVRYYLEDLELFKNSMTKNVALVDNQLQGKQYTSNKGGSGFGKFRELPKPEVHVWQTNETVDLFVGSHDGFKDIGVDYNRQVIYLKNDFWIVKDNFKSVTPHVYKQIWQGHYSLEQEPNLLRATFDDGSGLDIYQLNEIDGANNEGTRGKEWTIVSKESQTDFEFITIVFPYGTFDKRIDENSKTPEFKGWRQNASIWKADNKKVKSLTKDSSSLFFSTEILRSDEVLLKFSQPVDIMISDSEDSIVIQQLDAQKATVEIIYKNKKKSFSLSPGKVRNYEF